LSFYERKDIVENLQNSTIVLVRVADMTRAKVCMISQARTTSSIPPAEILSRNNYSVSVIATQRGRSFAKEERFKYGKIIRVPSGGLCGIRFPVLDNPLQILILLSEALRVNADVYHVHGLDNIVIGMFLGIIGRKTIYHIADDHPSHNNYPDFVKTLIRYLEGFMLKSYDMVITSTESLRKDRLRFHSQIEVIPYCPPPYSSLNNIEWSKKEKTIIYAGQINRKKGIDKILESLEIISGKNKNIKLLLVGEISENEERLFIRRAIKEKRLNKYIEMIGWLPRDELYKVIKRCDIALCILRPWCYSYVISIPWKLIDYMACGVPVIASKGLMEAEKIVKSAKCGILVDPEDTQEIANAVIYLLENDDLRSKMGKNAEDYVQKSYHWNSFEEKLLKVYAQFVQ